MIVSLMFAAAVAAQGSPEPAPAADPASAARPAPAAKPAEPAAPKKVCVSEAQLGSHFKQRICATPQEWERRRERDAEMMSRGSDNTGPSSQPGR